MKPITFTVLGEPIPKARPRVVRSKLGKVHTFTPSRTTNHERVIALSALAAGVRVIDGPVAIDLTFHMSTRRRVDSDNLAKGAMDSLNNIAWQDDSQVTDMTVRKRYDKANPRTVITIAKAEEAT